MLVQNDVSVNHTDITSIAFIDAGIENQDSLLYNLNADKVVILSGQTHGIDQITETLEQYNNVESVHIFSHGNENTVQLGNGFLSEDNLDEFADDLKNWEAALSPDADLLFYGCNVASGGGQLIHTISQHTQADVAASEDLTGHSSLGGDWTLEVKTGKIEAQVALESEGQEIYFDSLNLLVNGSFEANPIESGGRELLRASDVQGWQSWRGRRLELWGTGRDGVESSEGSNHFELDFTRKLDGIYQSIQTEAGQTYELSFDIRARSEEFDTLNESVFVRWNGKKTSPSVYQAESAGEWSTIKLEVEGTGGLDRLLFHEPTRVSDGKGPFLDNIQLTPVEDSDPEQFSIDFANTIAINVGFDPDPNNNDPAFTTVLTGDSTVLFGESLDAIVDEPVLGTVGVLDGQQDVVKSEIVRSFSEGPGFEGAEIKVSLGDGQPDLFINPKTENFASQDLSTVGAFFEEDEGVSSFYEVAIEIQDAPNGTLRNRTPIRISADNVDSISTVDELATAESLSLRLTTSEVVPLFAAGPDGVFWTGDEVQAAKLVPGADGNSLSVNLISPSELQPAPSPTNIPGPNFSPVANDDLIFGFANNPTGGAVGVNDFDVNGDALIFLVDQEPQFGTVRMNARGEFEYIPDEDFAGLDFFFYKVFDQVGGEAIARVDVQIV